MPLLSFTFAQAALFTGRARGQPVCPADTHAGGALFGGGGRGRVLTPWLSRPQAALFVEAGVDKVRLTGGEPTLRRDLPALVGRLAALPGLRGVGITTNGIALARQLPELRAAGARAPARRCGGVGVAAAACVASVTKHVRRMDVLYR
jgi:hypothetical protein